MQRSRTIDIDAPPDVVWAIWSDVERWREWTRGVERTELLSKGPLAVGLRARVHQPKLPPAVWTVTELDPGRRFVWISDAPGGRFAGFHQVEPRGAGSRASLGLVYDGPVARLVGWLTASITERYLDYEAQGLKRASEARVASA
jgi:uncharacterized membrane protein